jgi:replication factor C subunit 2/4
MLFYGPPGTGKTSTILALAKSLFGPALYRSRILELNASDERGIGIVREKVKNFARAQLSQPTGLDAAYRAQYPCPPFKIIILDEADSMTQDAQAALRRTMEQYSRITRFCLVCNYVTRIIEPLASRCSKFRFKSLDNAAAGDRVAEIARAENLTLDDGVIETLIRCGEGDLRRAITYLQSAARLVGATRVGGKDADDDAEMVDAESSGPGTITVRTIEEIAGVIPESILDNLVQAMQPKASGSAYEAVSKVVTDLVADGWSATQLVSQVCASHRLMLATLALTKVNSCTDGSCLTRRSPISRRTRSLWSSPSWIGDWSMVQMSICLCWIWLCALLISCGADHRP